MVDVDHFKRFNDSYGHLAGDECLRVVARCLRGSIRRPNDVAARYGGEEFAVILPNTDPDGARTIANRLQELIAQAAVTHTASPHGVVTVSIGAATAYPDPSPNATSLIADADVALYAAKAAGRDRVVSAEGGLLTG
jgi:diguanylate cyclase (GGDEF)-like protein